FALATTLTGLGASALAWGDYDNDGDLDLAMTGNTDGGGHFVALQRNNGNGTFTSVSTGFPAVGYSTLAWGDLDRDGDLDLIISGTVNNFPSGSLTRLYQNNG